jgi:hypothetical protein
MATRTDVFAAVSAYFEDLGSFPGLLGDNEIIAPANENPLRDGTTTTGALLWHLALLATSLAPDMLLGDLRLD